MSVEFDSEVLATAVAAQKNAAHDANPVIRLVAGPGTGKSYSIEERVAHLLSNGVDPNTIYAISYTRAAANDLQLRIHNFCTKKGLNKGLKIRATTLHSLALKVLRKAGVLAGMYPADPMVLDTWEVKNIFDTEFATTHNISKQRVPEIRTFYEAYWNTGSYSHPSYIASSNPITPPEQTLPNLKKHALPYTLACFQAKLFNL